MKPIFLLFICLFISQLIQAQVVKTMDVTAGKLESLLTQEEKLTITDLTLKGTIDFRDFMTLRYSMPALLNLDLEHVNIESCKDISDGYILHEANEIPDDAFRIGLLRSVVLPSTATVVRHYAFYGNENLSSIHFSPSLINIFSCAFSECMGLQNIYCYGTIPAIFHDPNDGWHNGSPFNSELRENCVLNVPDGCNEIYSRFEGWKDLSTIVEMPAFHLSATSVILSSTDGSQTTVDLETDLSWTASSDQPWLTISHASGTGSQSLTITASKNTKSAFRKATVHFSVPGLKFQNITVLQEEPLEPLEIMPGTLMYQFTHEELLGKSNLTLKGTIDVRDFVFMRDSMPNLVTLDLSQVSIAAYTGNEENISQLFNYPANEIPSQSFYKNSIYNNSTLAVVTLPSSIESIGTTAFSGCTALRTITIPSVSTIGYNAFEGCIQLTSLQFPEGLKTINSHAFINCVSLKEVNIPSSVTYIGDYAFYNCCSLATIKACCTTPVDLRATEAVFYNVNTSTCKLMVPHASKKRYEATLIWNYFDNIIEMPVTANEHNLTLASISCYPNPFSQQTNIEIVNPSGKAVSIIVYNLSGQKIRILVSAQKGDEINYNWDGRDEQGMMLPSGMYLLKVNEVIVKVMKR